MSLARIPIDSYTYWIHLHTKFSIFSLPQPPYRFSSWSDLDKIFICTRSSSQQQKKSAWRPLEPASAHFLRLRDFIPLGQDRNRLWWKNRRKFIRVWSPRATINWICLTVWWLFTMRWGGIFFRFDILKRWGICWQWRAWNVMTNF